jgi:hypothetical protein
MRHSKIDRLTNTLWVQCFWTLELMVLSIDGLCTAWRGAGLDSNDIFDYVPQPRIIITTYEFFRPWSDINMGKLS